MKSSKISLHSLMILGSKERKSLSGAIKCSKATSAKFWSAVSNKVKKDAIDPAWIVSQATDNQLNRKNGDKREIWSAWLVETIISKYYNSL